jgi:hypothetical protein
MYLLAQLLWIAICIIAFIVIVRLFPDSLYVTLAAGVVALLGGLIWLGDPDAQPWE